jgi:2-C-methyl-D-erythritol 4-phosphate cytidylyltransferase
VKTIAIIPAGGSGKRMGSGLSKQYLMLDGVPILVHTLRKFEGTPIIDNVILVVPEDYIEYSRREIVEKYRLSKVGSVLAGGEKRQDSVKRGIDAVGDDADIVVIHDGVRPFISENLINVSVIKALEERAVSLGVPVLDTVKSVDNDGLIEKTVDRKYLWLTQTPQTFKREVIKIAYQTAYEDNFYGTDDAALVERTGIKVRMIMGSYDNIKITNPENLAVGEGIVRRVPSSEFKVQS